MAALALQNDESSTTGTWIMVAGILIQLVAMVAFCVMGLVFARNVRRAPSWREKENVKYGRVGLLSWGLVWISAWILVRCVYRAIELSQGWEGYLISTLLSLVKSFIALVDIKPLNPSTANEPYFDTLDAMAMVFAQGGFCFCWPSWCLPDARTLHKTQEVKIDDTTTSSPASSIEKPIESV